MFWRCCKLLKKKSVLLYCLVALLALGLLTSGVFAANTAKKSTVPHKTSEGISAVKAKQLLIQGNMRYVSGKLAVKNLGGKRRADLVANGQKPFAVIVTCSDSRVPPEIIFDQGLGDLFVVRVAGNVVDPIALGSVEYGIEHLKAPLVVVMGHEKCGAVKATVDGGEAPGSIGAIVKKIKPSAIKAKKSGAKGDALYEKTTDLNIKATMAEIDKSPIIEELAEKGEVTVIGAKYSLTSGKVTFIK